MSKISLPIGRPSVRYLLDLAEKAEEENIQKKAFQNLHMRLLDMTEEEKERYVKLFKRENPYDRLIFPNIQRRG